MITIRNLSLTDTTYLVNFVLGQSEKILLH